MANFIVDDEHYIYLKTRNFLKYNLYPSRIIDETEANEMRARFIDKGGQEPYCYQIEKLYLKEMTESLMKVPNGGKSVALGVRFGSKIDQGPFNIVLEPVLYQRREFNGPISWYSYLDDTGYFSRIAPKFEDKLNYLRRGEAAASIMFEDLITRPAIKMALVGRGTFLEFVGNLDEFEFLRLEFARNTNYQLTVIFSRIKGKDVIISSALGATGMYLDDNDLIPPPFR